MQVGAGVPRILGDVIRRLKSSTADRLTLIGVRVTTLTSGYLGLQYKPFDITQLLVSC